MEIIHKYNFQTFLTTNDIKITLLIMSIWPAQIKSFFQNASVEGESVIFSIRSHGQEFAIDPRKFSRSELYWVLTDPEVSVTSFGDEGAFFQFIALSMNEKIQQFRLWTSYSPSEDEDRYAIFKWSDGKKSKVLLAGAKPYSIASINL